MGVNKKAQPMLLVVPEEEESSGEQGTVSTFLQSRIHESFTRAADQLYAMGLLTTEERIAISGCIGDALEAFTNVMGEKVPAASEIEVPIEVAQEILRNAIVHRRRGIIRIAQDEELGVPYSSEYLDLPDRTQDHDTLRELLELALMDEHSAVNSYDTLLDVVYQMDVVPGEDGPNREAYEEILSDERDHEKILRKMLGEPAPEPGLNAAAYILATHSRDKCMRCKKPPEYEMMWADGRAHAWFCESHLKKFISEEHDRKNGSDIPWIKEIMEGEALKNPTENTNPDVKSKFTKKATAQETYAKTLLKDFQSDELDNFVEELSKLEHDQWVGWTKDIAKEEDISEERLERWKEEWLPYEKLPEDVKKFDREYAEKVLDVIERELPSEISNIVLPTTEAAFFEELMKTGQIDMPRTLAIDLDGTILEYDGFKGVGIFGSPIDGAREALQKFKEDGWFIVIDTCRGEVPQVIEHLTLFDIPFDSVNDHPFQPSTANPGKPIADYRIDDSAIHFDGDWASVHDEISKRERGRSLRGVKIAWKPPIEKKIALQELADDLSDEEWLGVLVHTAGATGDSVALSRKVGTDTYRMVLCGSEYRAFRNFDPIYRSGGLFNKQELRESFEAAISSTDPITVDSILRELESCLLSGYRGHGFNNPEQWISITGTDIKGDHRIIYVEADLRGFARYNEPPVADPQSLLVFLKRIADGAFAYDPKKYILFDFLDPFGNRTQPTDYPDPAMWGNPEKLKEKVRKRRQRDKGEPAEELNRVKEQFRSHYFPPEIA